MSRDQEYRQKLKADPVKYAEYLAKEKIRRERRESISPIQRQLSRKRARRWAIENPKKKCANRVASSYNRSENSGLLDGSFTGNEWLSVLSDYGYQCAYCGLSAAHIRDQGFSLQVDHVIGVLVRDQRPWLAHLATNTVNNIVPACHHCNPSKSGRFVLDWIERKHATLSIHLRLVAYLDTIKRANAATA